MKKRVVFIALYVPFLVNACYTYRSVSDLESESNDGEIRITTRDAKVFHLYPWKLDSTGAVVGIDQAGVNTVRSRRFVPTVPSRRFAPEDIQTSELREYDSTLTIVAAVFVGTPIVLFLYMVATWDMQRAFW